MNFKTRKISKKAPKIPKPKKVKYGSKRSIGFSIPVIASLVIIIILGVGIVKAFSSIDFTLFLKVAGEELEQDAYGHTNFLLLGTGGKEHEGGNLTDTIIVASLDNENNLVTMLSIPRDLFIKDDLVGNSRINENYYKAKTYFGSSTEGLEHMMSEVEEIIGVPIHYYLKADFQGFKDLIDALGGIDIEVKEAIYDPYYPKDGTFYYETFSISAGQHHMDGETALKYARSRKTTSDFDRAERQQQLIFAIKEKAFQTNIIFSTEKITNILDTLKENIETNIKVKEILTLGSMVNEFGEEQISHRLIHDDPTKCGGFLYTPSRDLYGGLFVLVPAGGFEFIHLYSDLNFNLPNISHEDSKLHILNGTSSGGTAGEAKQILKRYCFDVVRFGNARSEEIQQTTYYYKQKFDEDGDLIEEKPQALDFLPKMIPGTISTEIPQEYLEAGYFNEADIVLEIGYDYVNSETYIDDPFLYLPIYIPYTPPTTATATEDETDEEITTDSTESTTAEENTSSDTDNTEPTSEPITDPPIISEPPSDENQ